MKKNIFFLLALLPMLIGCSQDDTVSESPVQSPLRFNIYDASTSGNGTRAVTEGSTMTTFFELGDKAGLYIVMNGNVVQANVQLTYNNSGFWEAPEKMDASQLTGAQFYAYYPYSATAQFDASSSTPFAAMVNAVQPAHNQSAKADYEAADIMVSTACAIGQYNAVSLSLKHQKAMVCMELPNSSYIFDNEGLEPYVLAKAENAKFTLGETAVTPYFDETSQSYRLIIEPNETRNLKVVYVNNDQTQSYEATNLSQVASGQYAKYVIDGGASLVNMTLEVGDFFCSNGRIVKKNATPVPDNVVGVVFKIGTTEAIRNANSCWSHAVVLAVKENTKAKWGNHASPTSAQNAAGWRYWYKDYGLADQNGVTDKSKLDESIMAEEGFETTKAWRAVPEPLTIGGETLDYTTVMNATMNSWIEAYPLPSVTSDWYIPSLVDWRNIEAHLSVVNAQLEAAGGKTLSKDPYWSCNVRGAGSNWCYQIGKTTIADRYYPSGLKDSRLFHFIFAF